MARSATTGIVFILAGLWTLFTLVIVLASVAFVFMGEGDGDSTTTPGTWALCSSVCIIINVLLIAVWHSKKKTEDRMDELASYLRMYRRTPLANVASRMNLDVKMVESLLSKCISKGQIHGFLDRNTNEFILKESIVDMKSGKKCPNCGGYSTDVSFPGEVVKCQFCDAVIPDDTPPPPPEPPTLPGLARGTRIMICSNCRKEIPIDSNLCPYCGQHF